MQRASGMERKLAGRWTIVLALGVAALVSGCGGGVHSMGVTMGCGINASPYLGGQSAIPVRCNPQTQSPSNWRG